MFKPSLLHGGVKSAEESAARKRAEAALQRVSAFYEAVIHNAAEGICVCFETTEFPYLECSVWNDQMAKITGFTMEDVNRFGLLEMLCPDEDARAAKRERFRRAYAGCDMRNEEWRVTRRDGMRRMLSISTSRVEVEDAAYAIVASVQDITERKSAEAALAASESKYRTFVDHAADALFLHDEIGRVMEVNEQACKSLQYERDELVGMLPYEFDPQVTPEKLADNLARLDTGETIVFDSEHRRRDGGVFPVEIRIRPFRVNERRFCLALARDITLRKQAEEQLRTSQRFVERIASASPFTMYVFDRLKQRVVYVNREVAADLGYNEQEVAAFSGERFMQLMHVDDLRDIKRLLARWETVRDDEVVMTEYRLKDAQGEWRWFLGRDVVFTRTADGRVEQIIGTAHDVTASKRAEMSLRESEARLRTLLENLDNVAVQAFEADGTITFWNKASERFYGHPAQEALGRDLIALLHRGDDADEQRRLFELTLSGGDAPPVREVEVVRRDGAKITVLSNRILRPRADRSPEFFSFDVDVTDRKRAEEELAARLAEMLHASRLTTVGQMVAALSHEVAQPLSAIGNFAAAAERLLDAGESESSAGRIDAEKLRSYVAAIANQTHRCAVILQRLRDYSRRAATQRTACEVNQLLRESVELIANDLRRQDIQMCFDLAEDGLMVNVDRIQVQQVLVNLLANARDAMSDTPKSTRIVKLTSRRGARTVTIGVADAGGGLSPNVSRRLFEPFFTTKPNGMGIGLSICHSILKDHAGAIEAVNNEQGGATFRVCLPLMVT